MKRTNRLVIGVVVVAVFVFLAFSSSAVLAHNAGHIHLPTGQCVDVGGGNEAPNENVDKYPNTPPPQDEFGARYAADRGNTPIYPKHCDQPGAHNHP